VTAHIRWQALLVLTSIVLLAVLVIYLAINFTTVVIPDRGGTYLEGIVGVPQYINPILCQYNQTDRDLAALVFNGLTKVSAANEIVPDLAQDFQVSPDGLTYVFTLKPEARWQDGTPVTADDVLFTVKAIQDPNFQGVPYLAEAWRGVRAEKVDDLTVKFTMAEPFTPFIDYTTVGLLPSHVLRDVPAAELPRHPFNLQPIGTGPYMVKQVTGESAVLEASPAPWTPVTYLNRLEFRFYPSYEAAFNAYERGLIEGLPGLRPEDMEWMRRHESLQLFTAPLSGYSLIYLNSRNPNTPFFQDVKVRQALLYALDRQGLIDHVLHGQGIVANNPILPTSWAYEAQIKTYPYDPDQAKRLLDEAGWIDSAGDGIREKDGRKLEFALLGSDDPQRVRMLEDISRQWAAVGVKARPETAGVSGLVRDFLRPRHFEALLSEWMELTPDPDPYPMWHSTQVNEDGQNYAGFVSPEADLAMEEARRITDRTRRAAMYGQFQKIFAEEVPALLLSYPVYNYAVDRLIHGVQLGPLLNSSDRFRTLDRWYIATRRVIVSVARQLGPALSK